MAAKIYKFKKGPYMSDEKNPIANHHENLRCEYISAHHAYLHYDRFPLTVGSIFIAGVFIFWGAMTRADSSAETITAGSLIICFLMSVWIRYVWHCRQIYLYKLHRIREIESELELWQHRRFIRKTGENRAVYYIKRPHGHWLDLIIYWIMTCGSIFLTWQSNIRDGLDCSECLICLGCVVLVITITVWIIHDDREISKYIRDDVGTLL